jgi:hypothetical protein
LLPTDTHYGATIPFASAYFLQSQPLPPPPRLPRLHISSTIPPRSLYSLQHLFSLNFTLLRHNHYHHYVFKSPQPFHANLNAYQRTTVFSTSFLQTKPLPLPLPRLQILSPTPRYLQYSSTHIVLLNLLSSGRTTTSLDCHHFTCL